jgi:hypothetical protein
MRKSGCASASERGGGDAIVPAHPVRACASALDMASASWSCGSSLARVRQRSVAKRHWQALLCAQKKICAQKLSALNRSLAVQAETARLGSFATAATRQCQCKPTLRLMGTLCAQAPWRVCSPMCPFTPRFVRPPLRCGAFPDADVFQLSRLLRVCPAGVARAPGACQCKGVTEEEKSASGSAGMQLPPGRGKVLPSVGAGAGQVSQLRSSRVGSGWIRSSRVNLTWVGSDPGAGWMSRANTKQRVCIPREAESASARMQLPPGWGKVISSIRAGVGPVESSRVRSAGSAPDGSAWLDSAWVGLDPGAGWMSGANTKHRVCIPAGRKVCLGRDATASRLRQGLVQRCPSGLVWVQSSPVE